MPQAGCLSCQLIQLTACDKIKQKSSSSLIHIILNNLIALIILEWITNGQTDGNFIYTFTCIDVHVYVNYTCIEYILKASELGINNY